MTYRELLKICTEKPGCISSREQKNTDAYMKYQRWLSESNKSYEVEKNKKDPRR